MVCATPFLVRWRDQAFLSWAGLRGAVPIVLATIPLSEGVPGARVLFDPRRGYGNAYPAGLDASRGLFLVMADADLARAA